MSTEGKTKFHRERDQEEETEETHPKEEEEAEKAATQDFVTIATRSQPILPIHAQEPREETS